MSVAALARTSHALACPTARRPTLGERLAAGQALYASHWTAAIVAPSVGALCFASVKATPGRDMLRWKYHQLEAASPVPLVLWCAARWDTPLAGPLLRLFAAHARGVGPWLAPDEPVLEAVEAMEQQGALGLAQLLNVR